MVADNRCFANDFAFLFSQVFSSDNGGPVYFGGSAGANNFPMRGGKTSNYQGGIRVNAFASGGLIPSAMRGKKLEGLGAVWDW